VAEIRRTAQGIVQRYQREHDHRLVDEVLSAELRLVGGENVPERKHASAGVSTSICPACAAWSALTHRR
jgi:hypothetical protein